MYNQNIVSLFKNLKMKDSWKQHCQGNTIDCSFNVQPNTKNNARNHFGISHQEEILFLRDTGFWNSADQGLVLTDAGLYCIPDNESPNDKFSFSWEEVKLVGYKDACVYFYGYSEDEIVPIHISYFTKNVNEYQMSAIGYSIANFLTRIAQSVKHVDPFEENNEKVEKLLENGKTDEALSLINTIISQDDGTYRAYWYLRLAQIVVAPHTTEAFDQAAKYCLKGLNFCEEGSSMSIYLMNQHWQSIWQFAGEEVDELDNGTSIMSIPNLRCQRLETLWVAQNATDEAVDGELLKQNAEDIFEQVNTMYCHHFTKQPYNERKVLLVVKGYSDLRQDSLCVMRKSDIPFDLSFPIGHPQEGQIYVGHPFIPTKYVPFEEYQLEFIEDKVREFTWLMQCMGATKISISAKNDNDYNGDYSSNQDVSGNSSYRVAKASGSFKRNSKGSFAEQISKAISLNQEFNPQKAPFVPDGLVWYQNEPSWQRLVNQRMTGSLMHASESIESRKSNMVNGSELQTIKAEFHSLLSLDGEWTKEEEAKFQQQENATLTFEIDFAPIESLNSGTEQIDNTETLLTDLASISHDEQEYLDEVKLMLEDGEIGPRERKSLERFAARLGISPSRALELESSLIAPVLTEDEKDYLEEVKQTLEDGEIGPRERKSLDRYASRLCISPERANEIEAFAAKY